MVSESRAVVKKHINEINKEVSLIYGEKRKFYNRTASPREEYPNSKGVYVTRPRFQKEDEASLARSEYNSDHEKIKQGIWLNPYKIKYVKPLEYNSRIDPHDTMKPHCLFRMIS